MRVLVFASQKGGGGKTTLALHLAVAAEAAGAGPVVLMDFDPQKSLTKWWRTRKAGQPMMAESDAARLPGKLRDLKREGAQLVIIDTPGKSSLAITDVIDDADLVLVPVKASAVDLWAVGPTLDACRALRRPFAVVVCQATRNASITVQVVLALSEHGLVAPVVIHNRVGYAAAAADGRAVQEIEPRGPGAMEISRLWDFVQKRMLINTQTIEGEVV